MRINNTFVLSFLAFIYSILPSLSVEEDANTLLLQACLKRGEDNVNEVAKALNMGADINIRDKQSKETCLMASTVRGKFKVVKLLLVLNADFSLGDEDGYSPVDGAAIQGRHEIMKAFIEEGVNVNVQHSDGFRPIHRACREISQDHIETFRNMVKLGGVDPSVKSKLGKRCEDFAISDQILEIIEEWREQEF